MRETNARLNMLISVLVLTLGACNPVPTLAPSVITPEVQTALQTTLMTETPKENQAEPTPTEETPLFVYQPDPVLPTLLQEQIEAEALPLGQGKSNEVSFTFGFDSLNPVGNWVYALVAPFPTVTDEVSATWLQNLWQGQPEDAIQTVLVAEGDLPALKSILGEPGQSVQTQPKDQILETAWTTQNTWAIIPFEEIQPRWKVLLIDGESPLHKDFNTEQYLLNVPISVSSLDIDDNFGLPPETAFAPCVPPSRKPTPFLAQTPSPSASARIIHPLIGLLRFPGRSLALRIN